MYIKMLLLFVISFTIMNMVLANTECVWTTGRVLCRKNQTLVESATIELYDLDKPEGVQFDNPLDPDDKVTSVIPDPDGLFKLEGCASDQDWIPGIKNQPEFYFRIHHYCNNPNGEFKFIWPTFKVFVPRTYDYHIDHPIFLD